MRALSVVCLLTLSSAACFKLERVGLGELVPVAAEPMDAPVPDGSAASPDGEVDADASTARDDSGADAATVEEPPADSGGRDTVALPNDREDEDDENDFEEDVDDDVD